MNIKITQHLLVTLLCFYSIIGMAADFIVTNTGDNGGVNPAVGAGTGTLRQAIVDANATTDPDVIKFNISGTGPHVITPSTNYEHITNPLTIDGTTQLGWVANTAAFPNPFNGTIKIAINFANTATNAQVFSNFSGLTIKGICVYGATSTTSQPFFSIQNVNNVNIYGCYFGIEADGMTFSNTYCQGAITFQTSGDNINIGSDLPAERNLFAFAEVGSGTNEYCLYFFNAFSGTGFNNIKIRGNYFNMKKDGVTVTSTVADNGIGFANIYAGNVWQIGGPNTEDGNLISGGKNGIVMSNNIVTSTTSVLIQKNIVGTDYTGLVDKGNRNNGIEISSTGKVIILDNLISGNDVNGLQDFGGTGATAGDSITVLRNIVGLNITATDAIPNTGKGMYIYQCNKSIIGDGTLANKNIIASNGSDEIFLQTCSGVKINTNYFGTKIDGVTPLPSAGHGIVFYDVQNSKILNNIITANGADGISVLLSSSLDNSFLTNSIYANAGLGIDLRNDDVTFNDATDGDAGPNYFLNFPKINSALLGSLTVDYTLDVPAGDYKMEVFGNPAGTGDPTKHGEGKIYLGSFDITHPGGGAMTFTNTIAGTVPINVGDSISMTTTAKVAGALASTSEFSEMVKVVNTLPVSLIKFDGSLTNCNNAKLTWVSATENNFKHYELQQATDGLNFTTIQTILPTGSNSTYKANTIAEIGKMYYRLKMVDINGTSILSNVLILNNSCDNNTVNIYPNPASEVVNVSINNNNTSITTMGTIYNVLGEKVKSILLVPGTNQIDVSNFAKGTYMLKLQINKDVQSHNFVVE